MGYLLAVGALVAAYVLVGFMRAGAEGLIRRDAWFVDSAYCAAVLAVYGVLPACFLVGVFALGGPRSLP